MATPKTGRPNGRPTEMTPETIDKLEQVFAIGGSDNEACFFAGIGKSTLYNYQNSHPEFVERKEALKEKPFLKARQTIFKSLDLPQYAFEYMKRKRKKEFGDTVDLTSDGEKITGVEVTIRK